VAAADEKAGVTVERVAVPVHGEPAGALRCSAFLARGAGKHSVAARIARAQGERVLGALADFRLAVAPWDWTVW